MTSWPRWKRIAAVCVALGLAVAAVRFTGPAHDAERSGAFVRPSASRTRGAQVDANTVTAALPGFATIAASFQTTLGCASNWDPGCESTRLQPDPEAPGVFRGAFSLPAGHHEFKVALDNDWRENYGQNAMRDGPNLAFDLSSPREVRFYYDHRTHWLFADGVAPIVVVAGNFQTQLGCSADWQPACLATWMQDPAGAGSAVFRTRTLRPGSYEAKVACDESWAENYGADAARDGANIPFRVEQPDTEVTFRFEFATRQLTIDTNRP